MTKSWRTALEALGVIPKTNEPTALLNIDDVNGNTLTFPDIADVSEISEGTAVTVADGDYVFEANGNTYTITVVSGAITSVTSEPTNAPDPEGSVEPQQVTPELAEALQAMADELAAREAQIEALTQRAEAAELAVTGFSSKLEEFKALMAHPDDKNTAPKALVIGGRQINLEKFKK